jgi:hypothetical protein
MRAKTTATPKSPPPGPVIDAAHPPGWVFYNRRHHYMMKGFSLCRKYSYITGKVYAEDGRRSPHECAECVRVAKKNKFIT